MSKLCKGSSTQPKLGRKLIPPKRALIPAVAVMLVLAIGIGFLTQLLSSGNYPFAKGATTEAVVKTGKDTRVGNSAKMGWEFSVPNDVMAEGTKITMKVLSSNEVENFEAPGFTMYGTPVKISGDGAHGVWFAQPVPVTIKIPKEYLQDLAAEELFFAIYENGVWRYFMPDNVNLQDGTASFYASHFSWLGFGRPSEEDQVKTFAQTYAAEEYDRQQKKIRLNNAVGKQLDELFKSMGVDSGTARKQLIMDAVTYLESAAYDDLLDDSNPIKDFAPVDTLMRMTDAAAQGKQGQDEFDNKSIELFSKAIAFGVEKHVNANKTLWGIKDVQTGYVDKTSKAITVLGGLGTAAGAFVEGDKEAGFEAIGNMLTGLAGPKAALITSTLNYAKTQMQNAGEAVQAYWTRAEIEEAYKLYIDQEGSLEGDFASIFALKGNAEALMNIRIVKAHCAKYGIKEEDMGSAARDAVIKHAWNGLRTHFEERKVAEPEIARLQKEEEDFIAALKKQGLLASYAYKEYFGIDKQGTNYDVSQRLRRLYNIRDAVLGCIDADKRHTIGNERLARAIEVWIERTEKKDKEGFFEYLRETGLYEQSFASDSEYAWVLVKTINRIPEADIENTNKGGIYQKSASAAPGNYTYTWQYIGEGDTYYDPDMLHGESFATQLTISVPPSVIRGGETVNLSFSLTFTKQKLSFFDGHGSCRADWGNLRFSNAAGKTFFEIYSSVKYSQKNILSVSDTIYAVIPAGHTGKQQAELWTGDSYSGTYYVYEWQPIP